MNIFMDTEFTDFFNMHLISIGMVSEKGDEFYEEVAFPINECSPFVFEAVIPQLTKSLQEKCSSQELAQKIINWLENLREDENVFICHDFSSDWDLFCDAINYERPPWLHSKLIKIEVDELKRMKFYRLENLNQHHALADAKALHFSVKDIKS